MDRSKDEQFAEYLDRMQLFSRAGVGDDSTGAPLSPSNPTAPTVAPPPIPAITITNSATAPPITAPTSTTKTTSVPISATGELVDSLAQPNSVTAPPITAPTLTIKTPPSGPISAISGGSINSLTQPNQTYADAFFNAPNDARSDFWGGITPESIPDVNIYQNKKTVAQGMMDLALFSANANQLRYVVENREHPYFWTGVIMISISLILQVGVGVGLLLNTRYNVKDKKEICIANKISNFTIVGIFLVTVINVFISAFGVASGTSPAPVFISPRFGNGTGLSDIGFRFGNDTDVGFRFANGTDLTDIGFRFDNSTELSESNFYFQ